MRTRKGSARNIAKRRLRKSTKGYRGGRGSLLRSQKETLVRAEAYAFRDRRVRKREFRKLWIIRINAAAREHGLNYSRFMEGLKFAEIGLDRKSLSEMAICDKPAFDRLAHVAAAALEWKKATNVKTNRKDAERVWRKRTQGNARNVDQTSVDAFEAVTDYCLECTIGQLSENGELRNPIRLKAKQKMVEIPARLQVICRRLSAESNYSPSTDNRNNRVAIMVLLPGINVLPRPVQSIDLDKTDHIHFDLTLPTELPSSRDLKDQQKQNWKIKSLVVELYSDPGFNMLQIYRSRIAILPKRRA